MQQSLPEQILLSASSRQNETALVCGKNTLTYKQLMCSAHEIALKLGSFELSKEHCVGIYIEKSFKAVEAILGTLFANCAYVPLDVKSPESQVSYIINDCQLSTFITDIRSLDSLTAFLTERHETAQSIVITD